MKNPYHPLPNGMENDPEVAFSINQRDIESTENHCKMPNGNGIEPKRMRYPFCVVWTPIPFLTWLFPFIGHMGIATSQGIIRDFAGPYYVSENDMAFGRPTKYWILESSEAKPGLWDTSVHEASEEYKSRMHNLFCDNCHSHVAMALNLMKYKESTSWNMIKLCFLMLIHGKYVGFAGFLKTWLPAVIFYGTLITLIVVFS